MTLDYTVTHTSNENYTDVYSVGPQRKKYKKVEDDFSRHIPTLDVKRMNRYQMRGALGMTYLDTPEIILRDDLSTDGYNEVKLHETAHQMDRYASEGEIRQRTKEKLDYTVYH